MLDYIHNDAEFRDLLAIVAAKESIDIALVEKDYWIMHTLYSLKEQGIEFELKGGTSLSKGFGLINRFSEDIDIHIRNNFDLVIEGNEDKPQIKKARKEFYDTLVKNISINGIIKVERDYEFDDTEKYRSGGIRLQYKSYSPTLEGLKDGILLEAGFDTTTPNTPVNISSWIWDHLQATNGASAYIENTAQHLPCYHPGYTLIEKLQTIVRKYRNDNNQKANGSKNFMRQYYDIYCLLGNDEILDFIGTSAYEKHKKERIKGADNAIPLSSHPAIKLEDEYIRDSFKQRYLSTSNLYYRGQPDFEQIVERINLHSNKF